MKAKRNVHLVDKFLVGLNILLCIALLLSNMAHVVDPKTAWLIAFFGLAYPLLLLANVIMVFFWMFRKKWYLVLSLVCIITGWNVLNNNIGFHTSVADPALKSGNVIRIMTYNVHNFRRYGSDNEVSTKHEILQVINQQQPDIIGFQEFYTKYKGKFDMRDSLIKMMGADHSYFQPIIFNKDEALGVAIFSKFPIIAQGFILLADKKSENACIYVDVKKGSQVFRVYSVHLQSISFDPEDYKYINTISNSGGPDMSSTRRLGSKLKNAFLKRSGQVVKIKEHAATCPYPYIISGDFNDTPASYAVTEMAKGLKNAFREKGVGFGRTYNGNFPNYQIDYILASPQFDIANYKIIEKKLSDHFPVRSDVVLR
ncbi:MAG TPA: endonuclease/exonuclease/phosphatase family protein [Mucilaginibacter sp.]|jgi:endonuclease/exonuclease/phosphatase family metal-dependent hydrolase|nr:endonuclease/exonuclease/phosphatase family protein [Mucilaginibacter sp.]